MSQLEVFESKKPGDKLTSVLWNSVLGLIRSAHNDADSKIAAVNAINGLIKSNGATPSAAVLGVDYQNPISTLSVASAGTNYTFTASQAAIAFGTTSPALTINAAGTYLLFARVNAKYVAATFAANQTLTLKLYRTNNTPADVTGSPTVVTTRIITTITDELGAIVLSPVIYTTVNNNDIISLYGALSVIPSAGSVQATEASILAVKIA